MKLVLKDVTITITPQKLAQLLKPLGYELRDVRPEEKLHARHRFVKDLRDQTFVDGKTMTIYEALYDAIPEALTNFSIGGPETKAANLAVKGQFKASSLYSFIQARRTGMLSAQISSTVKLGKLLAAMVEESPTITKTTSGGATVYKWMPRDTKWLAQGSVELEPEDEPDELYLAQRAAYEGEMYLPLDLRNRKPTKKKKRKTKPLEDEIS